MVRVCLAGLIVVGGCTGDTGGFEKSPCHLEVSPTLSDLNTVAVGTDNRFEVTLTATQADCTVGSISVLNIDGDYFYRPDAGGAGDTDAPAASGTLQVPKDQSVTVEVGYLPLREGYHRGQIQIGSDNDDGEIQVDVRAHADTPAASVFPWTVDFGVVEVGQTATERITIRNDSELRLTLAPPNFNPSALFGAIGIFPIDIEPADDLELEITAKALSDDPELGTLVLLVAEVPLQQITLRMNDCIGGTPSAYDRDQDGFTTCGGDCDDDNPAIKPGAPEVSDGADNDCNELIDDGTAGYDDDEDGYCDHPTACIGAGIEPGDCNDNDPLMNPGVPEIMGDGIDNDCDGQVDGGTLDYDLDGYTESAGDCDPTDSTVYPGAPEYPDGKDNDCDAYRDEGTVLYDDDNDGYCEGLPAGGAPCTDGAIIGDCNDSDDDTHDFAPELADWRDNDCDGTVDEGTVHYDDDSDGYTEDGGDCNDTTDDVSPAVLEIPGNGVDDDCNPATPSVGSP